MTKELQQEGVFRGNIISYGVSEAESGAVAIRIEVQVDEIFAEDAWHDWREHEFVVGGKIWVIKKDGTANKRQAEALILCAGWDGSFDSVVSGTWEPTPVSCTVEEDEYNGETYYRIAWLNPYGSTPGGGGNVSAEKAQSLDQRMGAQFRALAANNARNASVPTNGPVAPAVAPVKKN